MTALAIEKDSTIKDLPRGMTRHMRVGMRRGIILVDLIGVMTRRLSMRTANAHMNTQSIVIIGIEILPVEADKEADKEVDIGMTMIAGITRAIGGTGLIETEIVTMTMTVAL
jgi:hypothetical protein